ncbi:MAG: HlyD family efflux transporter periplasmic adaptor subunit, partial [Bacteroidota bacterium]
DIEVLKNRINTARQDDDERGLMASDDLKSSFIKLKLRVNQWINSNVIYSPIDGVVEIDEAVSEQQFIQKDKPLMIVIPSESRLLKGKMKLEFQNSGLVEIGQKVIIRLQRFPFEEFGAIEGMVTYKASVPDQDNFIQVEVGFPDGLITTTNYQITAEEALFGKGQIITEEKVLLNRIFRYAKSVTASL